MICKGVNDGGQNNGVIHKLLSTQNKKLRFILTNANKRTILLKYKKRYE